MPKTTLLWKTPPRGFTLVELLVVIVIIGVLAGLLLPSIMSIQRSARSAECKNNIRQIYLALELYRNSNEGMYPYAAILPSLHLNNLPRICDTLGHYATNPRVFRCAADGKHYFENEGSSYEYSTRLAGRKVLTGRGNRPQNTTTTPVFYDYEDFHGGIGTPGSRNFIYADGHVGSSHGVPPPSEDNSP